MRVYKAENGKIIAPKKSYAIWVSRPIYFSFREAKARLEVQLNRKVSNDFFIQLLLDVFNEFRLKLGESHED